MSEDDARLWILASNLALLSLLAVGGINVLIPEIHRQVVDVHGWMTDQRFVDFYAISQAAPGPNITVISLIGWSAAGWPGVLMANVAIIAPTSVLTFLLARVWERFRAARWRMAIQLGLVPVTIGLVASSAFILSRNAGDGVFALVITFATALAVLFTPIHPLLFLAAGAVLGIAGLV